MSQWEKIQLGDICQKANRLEAPVMGQPYRQLEQLSLNWIHIQHV